LRVISGSARGHKLIPPTGLNIRPTTDRIKEAVFSMIQNDLWEADFLDLFSGTGAIGIEALSRGAKSCTFVDSSKESIEIINKNIKQVSSTIKSSDYRILNQDILSAIAGLKDKKFDIIFMDPPYDKEIIDTTLKCIGDNNILKENAFIVIEQSKDKPKPLEGKFTALKTKIYGLTTITIMKQEARSAEDL